MSNHHKSKHISSTSRRNTRYTLSMTSHSDSGQVLAMTRASVLVILGCLLLGQVDGQQEALNATQEASNQIFNVPPDVFNQEVVNVSQGVKNATQEVGNVTEEVVNVIQEVVNVIQGVVNAAQEVVNVTQEVVNVTQESTTPVIENEDLHSTTLDMLEKNGYRHEKHAVLTDDGFILELHRIPPLKVGSPVVFLQHGMYCSSSDWIITGPGIGFAYILADAGYDVWMGNSRANTYSQKNLYKERSDLSYWQFSWHEKGYYDLPAMLDVVLERSNQSDLYYVGHSTGTTMMLVLATTKPEYQKKIRAAFFMSPAAYIAHVRHPLLHFVARYTDQLEWFTSIIGAREFASRIPLINVLEHTSCRHQSRPAYYCESILIRLFGFQPTHWNESNLPSIVSHLSRGISVREMLHWGQGIKKGTFCQYDLGYVSNYLTYGGQNVPCYDLGQVKIPIGLYYSDGDTLTTKEDVAKLSTQIPNVIETFQVQQVDFNHMDFLWADEANKYLYQQIIQSINKY